MWDTCYWTLIIALFNVYVLLLWATYVCKNGGLHWCKQLSSKWVEFFCLLAMYWQVWEWSGQRGKCFGCHLLEVIWRSNFWSLISFQLASHQWFFSDFQCCSIGPLSSRFGGLMWQSVEWKHCSHGYISVLIAFLWW